jgi:hypothetical protein
VNRFFGINQSLRRGDSYEGGDLVKKRKIVIICGVLAIVIIGIIMASILNGSKPIAPVGQVVSESELLDDVKQINKIEVNTDRLHMENNGEIQTPGITDRDGNVIPESKIIKVFVKNKPFENKEEGIEIRAAMRTWLYIHRHVFEPPIVGVYLFFRESLVMSGQTLVIVSKQEFEELLSDVDHRDSLSDEELIDQVANLWITKNNYTPWKL